MSDNKYRRRRCQHQWGPSNVVEDLADGKQLVEARCVCCGDRVQWEHLPVDEYGKPLP